MHKVNFHLHSTYSDGKSSPRENVLAAVNLGIKEIAFTDHLIVLGEGIVSENSMKLDMIGKYVEEIESLKREFKDKIKIRLGIEADYFPSRMKIIARILDIYSFDFVIGSVHRIGDEFRVDDASKIDVWKKMSDDELFDIYRKYFELVEEAVRYGYCDIIGHPDIVKCLGIKPCRDLTEIYVKAVKAIADSNVCVDVNSAGLKKPVGEIYPNEEFLRLCFENDVPVTIGNDSHRAEHIGVDLEILQDYVKKTGYSRIAFFEKRKRHFFEI